MSAQLVESFNVYMVKAADVRKRLSELTVSVLVASPSAGSAAAAAATATTPAAAASAGDSGDDLGATDCAERLLHDWAVQLVSSRQHKQSP